MPRPPDAGEYSMVPPTQFTPRICAVIAGLFGIAVSIVVYALYSICLVLIKAPLGTVFLVAAELGSFLVMGWLALLTAPLWLLAAFLPFFDRNRSEQSSSCPAELESWRNPTTV